MIRSTRLILGTFCFVLLFVFGFDWLMETSIAQGVLPHLDRWPGLKASTLEARLALASAGILLPLGVLSLTLAETALAKGIRIVSSGGTEVLLRPEAIERPMNRDVWAAVDSVLKVESEAYQASKGAGVKLSLTLSDRAEVDETQARVRAAAEKTLRRITGSADPGDIKVTVRDVRPGTRGPKPAASKLAKAKK